MKKKILSLVLTLCLIIPCVAFLAGCGKSSETTMSLSVNPEVSFVVDGKNKIVSVNYENEDAGTIYANVNFVGKDVDSAIQIFIEQSAISGHINLNGDDVEIEVNGSVEKDIKKVQEKAKAKVEEVFANLGVQVEVKMTELSEAARHESLVAAASVLAPEKSVAELKEMEDKALVELIKAKQKEYEGLAYNQIASIKDAFGAAKNAILGAIEDLRAVIDATQDLIDNYATQLEEKNQEIAEKEREIAAMAEGVQKEIEKGLLEGYRTAVTTLQTQLTSANQTITTTRAEIEAKIQTFLAEKQAEIEEAKAQYQTHKEQLVAAYKAEVSAAKVNFTSHLDSAKANGNMTEEQYNYWKNLVESANQ